MEISSDKVKHLNLCRSRAIPGCIRVEVLTHGSRSARRESDRTPIRDPKIWNVHIPSKRESVRSKVAGSVQLVKAGIRIGKRGSSQMKTHHVEFQEARITRCRLVDS
jgi:hypothetical protein